MYSRRAYVAALAVAVAALQFAAAFGAPWQAWLAYATAAGLGAVVFYQGERGVTAGPVFVSAGAAIVVGSAASLLFGVGLVMATLGTPWDLTLWRVGLVVWDSSFGVAVVFVSAFFAVGVVSALH